jgi:two-component system, cell cycle sensor histidine kinase and response regulator CckA
MGASAVAEIAAIQRQHNAVRATGAIAFLTALAIGAVTALHAKPAVILALTAAAVGQGFAYVLARSGRGTAGVLLCGACIYLEQIGVVVIEGELGPLPFIAPIVIMLVAATLESRWLASSFVSCLVALAFEGWLTHWLARDQETITAASFFAAVVFVVSLLHVRGTERAFRIAAEQDRARGLAAAEALDSERRYRLIADATDDLIALLDRDGRALYLSPSHERVLGLKIAPVIGKPVAEFLSLDTVAAAAEAFAGALARGMARLDLHIRRSDGTQRVLDAQFKRIDTDEAQLMVVASRDVTERRDLEMRLHGAERLDALGRLAGSVAHDFNNLLMVIGGATELARRELPPEHSARVDLDSVLQATQTATALARQLLTFSRKQIVIPIRLDLGKILATQRDLLSRMVGSGITLEYELARDLPAVMMPQAHFEQLALNMAVNARDAMPQGGWLRFSLSRRRISDREGGDVAAGEYVELQVRDNGAGIPPDVLPHVFEPFFSTKGARGTGLGLATCFGIVTQAGGRIGVESEVGKGSVFRVLLPAAEGAAAPEIAPQVHQAVRRVLVVDDESSVRETMARMLRSEGYEVHVASTLAEARRILGDKGIALDAMLADVVLGDERGTDLIEDCRRNRPRVRVVVMSGYTPDAGASQTLTGSGAAFLSKPFGRDDLFRAVRG